MNLLCIDYGTKKLGLAFSNSENNLPLPLGNIERKKLSLLQVDIKNIIEDKLINKIIFGLPLEMDGKEGKTCQRVRDFSIELQKLVNLPIDFQDERLTSEEAYKLNPKEQKNRDSIAATIILQDYLTKHNLN